VASSLQIPVSVMIFTLNEAANLPFCLKSIERFSDIIVIDSFSMDGTKEICDKAKVRFFQNTFKGFGEQRNWALDHTDPKHGWILILDADERVPEELADEISHVASNNPVDVAAYRLKRRFYMWGRWLRYSSLYPTWVVRLIKRGKVRYKNRGHAETQEARGKVLALQHDLIDENRKGIHDWFERQNKYSDQEALYELEQEELKFHLGDLIVTDPLKRRASFKRLAHRLPFRPFFYFLYSYFIRFGFLDGLDGFVFCTMKALYQRMIVIKKYVLRRQVIR
jgi:glycosyltransferase involved in cell wall biosynthesis